MNNAAKHEDVYIPGFDDAPEPVKIKPMHPPPDFLVTQQQPTQSIRGMRTPPHCINSEQEVLGGLMIYGLKGVEEGKKGLDLVKNIIHSYTDFYQYKHQLIYQAICELAAHDRPIDPVTIGEWFTSHGKENLIGGGLYVVELSANTLSAVNIKGHAEIVRDKAAQRQLLQAAQDIIDSVHERDGKEGIELLTDANNTIAQLCKENMRSGELKLIETGLEGLFREIEKRQNGTIHGVIPQWESIKKIIPKLEGGDLMILAARPGMGKSALALQWALHATQQQQASAIFSMEMGMNQILMRALSNLSNIPMDCLLRKNGLQDEDWSKMTETMRKMRIMPLAVDDSSALTVEQIRARATHFHSQCKEGLKLIVVDYIQLISSGSKKQLDRNQEIAHISRNLKVLAGELNCAIIALSQLNRSVEARADKTPSMADLRDSGALEQDADIVALLYRPAYYAKNNLPDGHTEADHAQNNVGNVCDFNIAKNRSGPIGHATLRAELQYCRFQDGTGLSLAVAEQNLLASSKTVTSWRKAA